MKKSIICALAASAMFLTGCNDFLDMSPRDEFVNNPEFWNSASNVQTYVNKFYVDFTGYGHGDIKGWSYFKSVGDDQADADFDDWYFTSEPGTNSYWSASFTEVRRANYALNGLEGSTIQSPQKENFIGIARLYRAWEYWQLVRYFGNVQWQESVVKDTNDPTVYGERTDRDVVVDNIVKDLEYAITNITAESAANEFSKDLARAILSDVCLYEGTYCKYRNAQDNAGKGPDEARSKAYLQKCVEVNKVLMGKYSLSENYGDVYNSIDLSTNKEVIFWRNYAKDVQGHSTVDYTTGSSIQFGITKDAIDAFLFLDGKPLATTTMDTDDKVEIKNGKLSIEKMLSQRDKRLSVLIDPYVAVKDYGYSRAPELGLAEMTSSTGYTIKKFYSDLLGDDETAVHYRQNIGTAYTDAPIFWLAIIYLNDAEAKAELGTINGTDLEATVNKLLARGGLPGLTMTPAHDPANNHNVSDLIWEIRRCRRCELMLDNWYRYWDMVRWHQLDKFDSEKYPNINRGANLTGINWSGETENGYIVACKATRKFDKKYYFFPLPSEQLDNSGSKDQNPGWK